MYVQFPIFITVVSYKITLAKFYPNKIFFRSDLTGGHTVFYMASYSYISDVSEPKMRTKRLAYLDGVFPLGFYLGNSLSGIIKKRLGFYYNFGLGILCASLAVLYCIFFVKDSCKKRDKLSNNQHEEEMQEIRSSGDDTTGRVICSTIFFNTNSFLILNTYLNNKIYYMYYL